MNTNLARVIFGAVVILAWVTSIIVNLVDRTYDPPASVHILMMLVAGALFGPSLPDWIKRNGKKEGD